MIMVSISSEGDASVYVYHNGEGGTSLCDDFVSLIRQVGDANGRRGFRCCRRHVDGMRREVRGCGFSSRASTDEDNERLPKVKTCTSAGKVVGGGS